MKYYEDFVVGQVDRFDGTYRVTEAEILEVGRRWDPQPFHTDPDAAAASVFGGLVASSVHLFAIGCFVGQQSQDEAVAAISALGFRNVNNHGPVRPEDVLSSTFTVLTARLSNSRPGAGVLTMQVDLTNQRDEPVFSYEVAGLYECRPAND